MFRQAGFDPWLTTIMHHLSHVCEQAPDHRVGAVELRDGPGRSCALTAVSSLRATGMQRKEQTVRSAHTLAHHLL